MNEYPQSPNDYRHDGQWQQNQQWQQSQPPQPPHVQYNQQIYYQRPRTNGMGVAGFVLAVCGIVFCWIPFVNILLWILGLVFSFIGLFKAPRGLAIAGMILSFIEIIIAVIAMIIFGAALLSMN